MSTQPLSIVSSQPLPSASAPLSIVSSQPLPNASGQPDPGVSQPRTFQASIGPREGNAATQWLEDLEGDVRYGSGNTFIGRALQKMGAEGTSEEVPEKGGDFMASPILGTSRAVRGLTELPSRPWQGTKDFVGGTLDATQIPAGMMASPAGEGAAEGLGQAESAFQRSRAAAQAAAQAQKATDDWQRINDVLGVTGKGIRIGKNASGLEDAATMPGRGVANLGITSDELSKMSPIERMAAIAPHWNAAGTAINTAVKAATDAGKTLDAGDSAFDVLKGISDPTLQDKAIGTFNNLAKQLGIQNLRQATPQETLQLRRALASGARFTASGDLNSLSSIRAGLQRAVSSDLKDAVPSLTQLDQNYSDLTEAVNAAQDDVKKFASNAPPPTGMQKARQFIANEMLPAALKGGTAGALGYGGYVGLRKLLGLEPGP